MLPEITELQGQFLTHHRLPGAASGTPTAPMLHVVTAGPEDGTPVVLLHGFPDFWLGWRHQIPALAAAGYRVIVPDQRGYASSDKPPGLAPYRTDCLADDVIAIADALGVGTFHVVGHDWGGGVAWVLAGSHPERLRSLTVINCPQPHVLRHGLFTNLQQLAKSWYMLLFQIPWISERVVASRMAVAALTRGSPKGTFTDDDVQRHREAATIPAMRAALAWYRAALWMPSPRRPILAPTLLLWGTHDRALGNELAEPSLDGIDDATLTWVDGASHWVPQERPDEVNAHLLQRLGDLGGPDPFVYKIVPQWIWSRAGETWEGSDHDQADGFIHLSAAHQVEGTLRKHFAGQNLLVRLTVDPSRLPHGTLRWEVSRGGARFPHLYGPLPRAAVIAGHLVPASEP